MTGSMPNNLRPIDKPWTEARAGDVLAVTESQAELLLVMRIRAEAAGFAYLDLDHAAGLASGHSSKIFQPGFRRTLGPSTLDRLLKALGLRLAVVAGDPPVPSRPKNYRQDRHPLVSKHLPSRNGHLHPEISA
jgi:hypothetical protein